MRWRRLEKKKGGLISEDRGLDQVLELGYKLCWIIVNVAGSLGRGLDHGLTWPLSRVDGISSNDGCVNRFSGVMKG